MKKDEFFNLMHSIPKAELHVHEEAVLRLNTIKKVYERSFGKSISSGELSSLFKYKDLSGFLDSFIKIQSYFTDINDLKFLFEDFADYLEDNNIVYCETFFSPTSHLKKGWDFSQMIGLVSKSIEKIQKERKRTVRLIIDVSRSFGLENAMHNLDLVLKEKSPYIIGIGLGGNEAKGPAQEFISVFEKARKNGLHVVAHAGEVCGSSSVDDAIEKLGAERIGHGISSCKDDALMKKIVERRIPMEICPTSNVFTRQLVTDLRKHPVRELYDRGAVVTINTDDPAFFKVSLIEEYWNIYYKLRFKLDDIKVLIENSFTSSFAEQKEIKKYLSDFEISWQKWFAEHPSLT